MVSKNLAPPGIGVADEGVEECGFAAISFAMDECRVSCALDGAKNGTFSHFNHQPLKNGLRTTLSGSYYGFETV
jgi:hypothetical protein